MSRASLFAVLLLGLSACASAPVPLTVAGRAAEQDVAQGRKHAVLPADGDTVGAPYAEVAAKVNRALRGAGFVTVEDPAQADVLIFLSYGDAESPEDENHLALTAYAVQPAARRAQAHQSWMVQVTAPASAGSFRKTLPAMLRAAQPQLGKTTAPRVLSLLSRRDPGVRYIDTGASH
ncbi:MAG: hypothetical protein ABW042_01285 [Phenylobacterium sp.]